MADTDAGQLNDLCEAAFLEAAEMHGYLGSDLAHFHISEDARHIALARLGGVAGRSAGQALEETVTALLGAILRRHAVV